MDAQAEAAVPGRAGGGMRAPASRSWITPARAAAILLALDALVVLAGQWGRDLVTVDDLREAEVAREMWAGGDVVIPSLAGLPFVEKPPGFPALVAAAYGIAGGPSVPAARLVSAGFALATLLAVFLLGRRALGPVGGAAACTLLAVAPCFCRTAHEILLDNALTAAVAFALLFAWIGLEAAERRAKRRAYAGAMLALGCSFLFKGLVGPALFGAGFVAYLLLAGRVRELLYWLHPLPLAACALPILAWVAPFKLLAPPDIFEEWFVRNHFGRFTEAYQSHVNPVYMYLQTIWYKFAPASALLPFAAAAAWRARRAPEGRAGLYFLASAAGPLALLTASRAKAPVYLLPAYPALALLAAGWLVSAFAKPRWTAWVGAALLGAGAAGMAGAAAVATGRMEGVTPLTIAAGAVVAWGAAAIALALRQRQWGAAGLAAAALGALACLLFFSGPLAAWETTRQPWRPTAQGIRRAAGEREILLYRPDDELRGACAFYRNRTAPEINDAAALVDRLRRAPRALAVVRTGLDGHLSPELTAGAAAAGVALVEEDFLRYYKHRVKLLSATPLAGTGPTHAPK